MHPQMKQNISKFTTEDYHGKRGNERLIPIDNHSTWPQLQIHPHPCTPSKTFTPKIISWVPRPLTTTERSWTITMCNHRRWPKHQTHTNLHATKDLRLSCEHRPTESWYTTSKVTICKHRAHLHLQTCPQTGPTHPAQDIWLWKPRPWTCGSIQYSGKCCITGECAACVKAKTFQSALYCCVC